MDRIHTHGTGAPVSLELALVADESGSIDATEWGLQMQGYVAAFQNPAAHAVTNSPVGGIAATFIQFDRRVRTGIEWTTLPTPPARTRLPPP